MTALVAILLRELRAYFYSPFAWVVLAAFLFINGIVFVTLVSFLNSSPSVPGAPLEYFFGGTIMFWLALGFVGPVIPMRLLSEERRAGTIEFLMTAPVTETQVVVGKYSAALLFYVFLWSPTLVYVGLLARYSELDWGPIASAYLGVLGVGALFLAAGLLSSALARSQVVAAIVGFALVFLLFFFGFLELLSTASTWREAFAYLNVLQHMEELGKGIVDTRRLVYYASAVAFLLFLSVRALEERKWR